MPTHHITPVPKPRQTQADKWRVRPCVARYRAFADEVRRLGVVLPESGARVVFVLPMPKSWSKKKKAEKLGTKHQQVPDLDNLVKALKDAVYAGLPEDDCVVWDLAATKLWGTDGLLIVEEQGTWMNRRE